MLIFSKIINHTFLHTHTHIYIYIYIYITYCNFFIIYKSINNKNNIEVMIRMMVQNLF